VSGPIGSGRISTSKSGESGQLGRSSATLRHPHFRYARYEVPRGFRTVHQLGWTIWKGEVFAPT
jgi:hypothetical protein